MAEPAPSGDVAQILLAAAEQNLAACEALAEAPGIGDAIVGFHAQQAVENAIQAVLSRNGVEFRRTHDLPLLLDLLHDRQLPAPPGADWLDELNPYAAEARHGVPGTVGLDRPKVFTTLPALLQWARAQLRGAA
ncbi:HEPN domain-containing protein [Pseudorhodoferax sp.]|uniref:HEPN domain-containing protein n=1 Tax=Pseudorhodoferax sp. TaxID=1993553 RepID=UPI002DD6A800|nr:HEPN domain-containing protein [Pseudorhodoferax sp.]